MFWGVYLFFRINQLVTAINRLSSVFIGYGSVIFGLKKRLTSYGLGYQFCDQLTRPNRTFEHYSRRIFNNASWAWFGDSVWVSLVVIIPYISSLTVSNHLERCIGVQVFTAIMSARQKRNCGDLVAIIFRSSAYCGSHKKPVAFAAVLWWQCFHVPDVLIALVTAS